MKRTIRRGGREVRKEDVSSEQNIKRCKSSKRKENMEEEKEQN